MPRLCLQKGAQFMSYDIYLKEPVTGEVASVPGHLMIGGTYTADYHPEIGTFTPALNTEALVERQKQAKEEAKGE